MEISKDQLNEDKQGLFIQNLLQWSQHYHLHGAETQRQAESGQVLLLGKRKASGVSRLEAVGMGKLEAGYQEAEYST